MNDSILLIGSDKGLFTFDIKQDKLEWEYHVSDLKKWNNAASRTYGVSSIPSSFLLDADGIIVAKGPALRGMGLHTNIDGLVESLKK